MKSARILIKRNVKLFFKDKGTFFTALITPVCLLFMYVIFLADVYKDSFLLGLPEGVTLTDSVLNALVGGQLASSLLTVSCVTVAFCSNFLSVQDKASGILKDFHVSPVKPSALAISYFVSSFITTFTVCLCAVLISLVYLAIVGWYISILDILLVIIDVVILVLFGTALSSVLNFFLSSQGQISAVGTIVSSGYGFVCGAYMPISNFGSGLQTVIKLFPGTYGTSLLRNHTSRGVLAEMQKQGIPDEVINSFRDIMDSRIYFGETQVDKIWMYVILIGTITVLGGVYVLLNRLKNKN